MSTLTDHGAAPVQPVNDTETTYAGAVVGVLTRQNGDLVLTEPAGNSFRLTSELTFSRWIGSQMFVVGEVQGDRLAPVAGSPVGRYSRCAGVLSEVAGKVFVGGGCGGVEVTGVAVERVLALRSEKVTLSILPCTESHGGRLQNPPIDAYGEEQAHTCSEPQAGGPNGE